MINSSVEINDKAIQEFLKLLKVAYEEAESEILTATSFGSYNRRQIQKQIIKVMQNLGEEARKFLEEQIPEHYKLGANEAVQQLDDIAAALNAAKNFNVIHKEAIFALIDDVGRSFATAMTGVSRSSQTLLNQATRDEITQRLAIGKVTGATRKEIVKDIKAALKSEGLEALRDRAGKPWTLDRYAEMLFKTKFVEARNRGFANRMVENGYDLVQVSDHLQECELCRPWEGRILSLTGSTDGYPSVADAQAGGLFHPSCRHSINVMIPELAVKTRAYYSKLPTKAIAQSQINKANNMFNAIQEAKKGNDEEFKVIAQEGWSEPGLKEKFDMAMLTRDKAGVSQMLSQVPTYYKTQFKDEIQNIVGK